MQEPAASRSPGFQQDSTLLLEPTVPPPEAPSEGQGPSPAEQAMEEEFQFLCCQGCKTQAKCPKLLPCLHTLCSGCLEALDLQCPICQTPRSPDGETQALDNVFFESLQRRLSVYQQIMDQKAMCTRCQEPADFWCFECEQLLCVKCFEAHQWFLKHKHEARPLSELRSQSVGEFLGGTRKSNNIFCSNTNHRTPTQISIYCQGCCKPLCCTCALLDRQHSDLQCDIGTEIQTRQEELATMMQKLQEHSGVFERAQKQMDSAIRQLSSKRADTEELIRKHVSKMVEYLQAQERKLLDELYSKYQRDHQEMAGHLGRLDAVLQRIQVGGTLVKRMKLYASDEEVLAMHDFLHQALNLLFQEKPHNLQASLRTNGFEEFKVCLQDLTSCITQATDAAVSRRPSPTAVSTCGNSIDIELPNEEEQRVQTQTLELTETQPVTVVQSVPGAHPMPECAFSIKSSSYVEEASQTTILMKRKNSQTQCSGKMIKLETKEEKAVRVAAGSPEQPRPSTSKAVSPPILDEHSNTESHIVEEVIPLTNNHVTSDTKETEERIVVISSSEDSDTENSSSRELDDSSSESSDLQLEGPSSLKVLDESLADPQAEDRPLVFFDLKIDNETQKISQLAAVNRESKFRVLIQPEAFSIYSKAVSLEVGLQHFLGFLTSMHRPILACYKLWGPGLPSFFRALDDIDKLWEFQQVISGFLSALPLIRERVPGASSFKLKNLAKTYLARNMSERSALAAVLAMRDLCSLLEVSPGPQLAQHVYSFSSLQCFASLQPLLQAGVLPRAEARLLALHNVSFIELLTEYRSNPQSLKKYGHYLSLKTSATQATQYLQALSTYLEGLLETPALAQTEGISTPLTGHSFVQKTS